jgi:hypothetical protein
MLSLLERQKISRGSHGFHRLQFEYPVCNPVVIGLDYHELQRYIGQTNPSKAPIQQSAVSGVQSKSCNAAVEDLETAPGGRGTAGAAIEILGCY